MSSSSHNKRHSILPPLKDAGPRAPVRFSSSLIIAESAILTGVHTITLRTESLVHPRARVESQAGPVDVGKRCIVQERTHIGAAPSSSSGGGGPPPVRSPTIRSPTTPTIAEHQQEESENGSSRNTTGVTLRDYCVVEAGAVIEAGGTIIGEGSRIGVGSRIGRGAVIGEVSCLCFFIPLIFTAWFRCQEEQFLRAEHADEDSRVTVLHHLPAHRDPSRHEGRRLHRCVLAGQTTTRQA